MAARWTGLLSGGHNIGRALRGLPHDTPSRPTTSTLDTAKRMQLYWDVITMTESQFLLQPYREDKVVTRQFRKHIVKEMEPALRRLVKQHKVLEDHLLPPSVAQMATNDSVSNPRAAWRSIGASYSLLYLPEYFKDLIWCKSDTSHFHVILPRTAGAVKVCKDWLLALLEFANWLEMPVMRLYVARTQNSDALGILLRNLNWLGGEIIANEDRNAMIMASDTNALTINSDQSPQFQKMMLGDEDFVILEFEC